MPPAPGRRWMVAVFPEGISHDRTGPAAAAHRGRPHRPRRPSADGRARTSTRWRSPWSTRTSQRFRSRRPGPGGRAPIRSQPLAWRRTGVDGPDTVRALTDDLADRLRRIGTRRTTRGAEAERAGRDRRGRGPVARRRPAHTTCTWPSGSRIADAPAPRPSGPTAATPPWMPSSGVPTTDYRRDLDTARVWTMPRWRPATGPDRLPVAACWRPWPKWWRRSPWRRSVRPSTLVPYEVVEAGRPGCPGQRGDAGDGEAAGLPPPVHRRPTSWSAWWWADGTAGRPAAWWPRSAAPSCGYLAVRVSERLRRTGRAIARRPVRPTAPGRWPARSRVDRAAVVGAASARSIGAGSAPGRADVPTVP